MEILFSDIKQNQKVFEVDFENCSDFLLKEVVINGVDGLVLAMDGLVDSMQLSQMIMEPLLNSSLKFDTEKEHFDKLKTKVIHCAEQNEAESFEDLYYYLTSGFAIILINGYSKALCLGIQGWTRRQTGEPSTEANIKGAKECFVESANDNKALLRKRLKTNHFKQKQLKLGFSNPTPVIICYMDDRADINTVNLIEKRLTNADLSSVQDYGELQPFIDTNIKTFFSTVGNTERPDVLASKLLEGRIAVIVEGTPFVMYTPYLFSDNFSALDDYDNPSFYSGFMRVIRYASFLISLFLPGFFVAVGTFHQELIPTNLLFLIATNESTTPFSLVTEAVMAHLLYEIMREGGLRLPESIGHAVSIIGAIVIGDAAVSAGIIGAPMLVVVAITAISSYVIYPLYESIAVLRIGFIIIGGLTGIFGIFIFASMLFCNICSLNPLGIPFSAPFSPLTKSSLSDILVRTNWKKLSKRNVRINNLEGVSVDK